MEERIEDLLLIKNFLKLFDVYYENTTGTLNVLMENNEPVIAALNLSLGKVITLSNDTNLKKLCNYVVDQVNA